MTKGTVFFLIMAVFLIFQMVSSGRIDFSSNEENKDRSIAEIKLQEAANAFTTKNRGKEKIGNFFINNLDQIIVGPNNIDYLCENIFKSGKSCDDDGALYETLFEIYNYDKNILVIHADDLMKPIQFHVYNNGYTITDKEAREIVMEQCIDYSSSLNLSENCIVIIQNNIIVNSTVEEYIRQNAL
tara:strand:+ start:1465 stop:2019 length:555 start_codon:yes stop_codon:yes gene_type:complete